MLGPNLLVAPVFCGEGRVDYYLPEGRWTRLLANETVSGGGWRREEHDVFSLPLLVRPGSIIPFGGGHDRPDYDYADGVVFHVFELADGTETTATIPDLDAEPALTLTSCRTGDRIVLAFSGRSDATLQVLLRGIDRVRSVSGGLTGEDPLGTLITPTHGAVEVEVTL